MIGEKQVCFVGYFLKNNLLLPKLEPLHWFSKLIYLIVQNIPIIKIHCCAGCTRCAGFPKSCALKLCDIHPQFKASQIRITEDECTEGGTEIEHSSLIVSRYPSLKRQSILQTFPFYSFYNARTPPELF